MKFDQLGTSDMQNDDSLVHAWILDQDNQVIARGGASLGHSGVFYPDPQGSVDIPVELAAKAVRLRMEGQEISIRNVQLSQAEYREAGYRVPHLFDLV